jgi:hypothetical protein
MIVERTELSREELKVWSELRLFDEAFRQLLRSIPESPEVPKLWTRYKEGRAALGERITALSDALQKALPMESDSGPSMSQLGLACILMQYDERELEKTTKFSGERPPRFQAQYCGLYDGGDRFYRYLDELLAEVRVPSLVLQLFLFCMQSGFLGKYPEATHLARQEYQAKLVRRVAGSLALQPASEQRPRGKPIEGIRFPFAYYGLALVGVLLVALLLNRRALDHERDRTKTASCLSGDGSG